MKAELIDFMAANQHYFHYQVYKISQKTSSKR